jgi:hypothetical protein
VNQGLGTAGAAARCLTTVEQQQQPHPVPTLKASSGTALIACFVGPANSLGGIAKLLHCMATSVPYTSIPGCCCQELLVFHFIFAWWCVASFQYQCRSTSATLRQAIFWWLHTSRSCGGLVLALQKHCFGKWHHQPHPTPGSKHQSWWISVSVLIVCATKWSPCAACCATGPSFSAAVGTKFGSS